MAYLNGVQHALEVQVTGLVNVDQSYNAQSENPQSGVAVAQALADAVFDASGVTVDQQYNPESENAQSGKAVAEAIANITPGTSGEDKTYTLIEAITLTEDVESLAFSQKPDGNPYNFSDVVVRLVCPVRDASTKSNFVYINNQPMFTGIIIGGTTKAFVSIHFRVDKGRLFGQYSYALNGSNLPNGDVKSTPASNGWHEVESINDIIINGSFITGTNIYIYGVEA